ncbi:NADPH-dependent oxidoreductase [Latilactobacillus sakei]|uniref:NADPH-dependent oxidoreductase n=1 Tax=Latilactobacillus sakei TaxID=1599 RepID=UPI000A17FA55|nr:NADPH-dependent oxidoreductase [Latilactobacillus sakei]ARJ71888.1 NADPH-dependent oxidoreductase [Latilactobacillus sakei]
MSDLIAQMQHHVSVRNFEATPLSAEVKQQLIAAAQSGSSSNFVQAFSIIEVTDLALRTEIATISNSASYVNQTGTFYVFVADLYRQASMLKAQGQSLAGIQNMEALLVASVDTTIAAEDTTIAAEDMAVAAESLGLGICYIGGIRNNIARVAELLGLPEHTVPLFGLTVGIPKTKNQVKPRLPQINQVAQNQYPRAQFADLKQYDQQIADYYANRGSNQQQADWTSKNLDFFSAPRRPEVGAFLKKQGFTLA